MTIKTIINHISRDLELIHAIYMFLDQIQVGKDVMGVVELIYPRALHLISPSMDPNTRERWASFSSIRVARVLLGLSP